MQRISLMRQSKHRYLEQGSCFRPVRGVLGEAEAQEVLELGAPRVGLLEVRDALGCDQEEGLGVSRTRRGKRLKSYTQLSLMREHVP
jgi:hypothetical protein